MEKECVAFWLQGKRNYQEVHETSGSDGYVHYLDYNGGFTRVYIYMLEVF